MLLPDVLEVFRALQTESVDYVVVGVVALNIHGIGRATEDLDFFVGPEAQNIDRLRRASKPVYDDPCIDEISTQDLCGDFPAVRDVPPQGDFYLDVSEIA